MALNKVNLLRIKSGQFHELEDGDVIQYSEESGLYLQVGEGDFAESLTPFIETSKLNNDAGFITPEDAPVRNATIRGEFVSLTDQVLHMGQLSYTGEVLQRGEIEGGAGGIPSADHGGGAHVFNGAYAQHWVSVDDPGAHPASGKEGDLWFVV